MCRIHDRLQIDNPYRMHGGGTYRDGPCGSEEIFLPRFSSNSEVDASELRENIEDMFPHYL